VYASRTRFIPKELEAVFEVEAPQRCSQETGLGDETRAAVVDVAARMRDMWQ
jgi:hypothetical protein